MLTGSDPYNNDSRATPDFIHKDILSSRHEPYSLDYFPGFRTEPVDTVLTAGSRFKGYETSFEDPNPHGHRRDGVGITGLTSGNSIRGYNQTSFEDPNPLAPRREGSVSGLTGGSGARPYQNPFQDPNVPGPRRDFVPGVADLGFERPNSLGRSSGPSVEAEAEMSNVLFIDGLPTDCTRREIGHLFRPFIGFRELRVVHKEPRHRGDKAMVLCFVEFTEAKCALTALEALQGYKFDDKKPDSPDLKIHFAHFPFRPPSDRDVPRV